MRPIWVELEPKNQGQAQAEASMFFALSSGLLLAGKQSFKPESCRAVAQSLEGEKNA